MLADTWLTNLQIVVQKIFTKFNRNKILKSYVAWAMNDIPLTRQDLCIYFAIPIARSGDCRTLHRVLRDLDIKLRGGTTRWPVVWQALGLSEDQNQCHYADLTAPLLTAQIAANLLGHADPSIIYRWSKGQLALGVLPFPNVIDLSSGRANARSRRWRQAELLAWHCGQSIPQYAKAKPVFGSLKPIK